MCKVLHCGFKFHFLVTNEVERGLPRSSVVKNPMNVGDAGDTSSVPGLGRYSGGGHGNPLQYSCLENPVARGAWQTTVHGVEMSQT